MLKKEVINRRKFLKVTGTGIAGNVSATLLPKKSDTATETIARARDIKKNWMLF